MLEGRTQALFEARAEVVKALAHPTRLFMVDELSRGDLCVSDLRERIGADLSTVSKHLTILKNAGIVGLEKRGTQVFYRLRVPCVTNFFKCIEAVLRANAEEKAALFENTLS